MVEFKIKSYGVAELATMYFPNLTQQSASNQFRIWLNKNITLKSELNRFGYKKNQKIYTPKQVGIIINYLGIP